MTGPRRRVPYFDLPASQQPLRIRATDVRVSRRGRERAEPDPLEQLVVGRQFTLHPDEAIVTVGPPGLAGARLDADWVESLDANNECEHGHLPGGACACWQEPDVPEFVPEPDVIELEVVPEIPDWVLADARDLVAGGMTLRKVATAVLPATGLPDIPSCEDMLRKQLQSHGSLS